MKHNEAVQYLKELRAKQIENADHRFSYLEQEAIDALEHVTAGPDIWYRKDGKGETFYHESCDRPTYENVGWTEWQPLYATPQAPAPLVLTAQEKQRVVQVVADAVFHKSTHGVITGAVLREIRIIQEERTQEREASNE